MGITGVMLCLNGLGSFNRDLSVEREANGPTGNTHDHFEDSDSTRCMLLPRMIKPFDQSRGGMATALVLISKIRRNCLVGKRQ
jgi:hypothetical protein